MPELPEVETVRRGLAPHLVGRRIVRVDQRRPDLRWPMPPDLVQVLTGALVTDLRRRSKYILADLDRDASLLLHLGMSGRIRIEGEALGRFHHDPSILTRHDHLVLTTEDGTTITLNDARRFGAVDLVREGSHRLLAALGPEPFDEDFTPARLMSALAGKKAPIKAALLDQRIVAGLGNIYVCEALFRAGIHPTRASGRIGPERIARLHVAIREVLLLAIEAGGSSLRDHRQTSGELGYFQHSFRVYGREGQPCLRDGCGGTVRRIVQSGRSTWYCPDCQR
ncbi:bifunctional DNA-formamidopyrimidine glycosylase/DNA-(apurinic or apyrimidinic site) lyase [Paracoccus sp. MC1854]|uniref:bifunctional DNA-formamidopyrimidine glycosylase/DNA-(apurinic or apyrimidinic site) lyase n=1 Tax=Paracoccus sp. MC1854 TaxID=2760306 RepID=UPI001604581F|nr:bifunctional DNA-formamidopyrimidine glycosylase/DNA-(apurinic or apyrimidinic site) lyase [Paracoccus sp. MC1854]MBB1491713.1 bifunctional DNA-formamidopyrimidine glycosylase/DNA-(apurinic or apyrimidinic site) lyase [Paracoccus sp. MC1854]